MTDLKVFAVLSRLIQYFIRHRTLRVNTGAIGLPFIAAAQKHVPDRVTDVHIAGDRLCNNLYNSV